MEGWVDLGSLIAAWPGIEPTTAWLQVRRSQVTNPKGHCSDIYVECNDQVNIITW